MATSAAHSSAIKRNKTPRRAVAALGDPLALLAGIKRRALHLQAECGPYTLEFDLEAGPEADAALRVGQGFPIIIERYGVHRSARVRPRSDEIRLGDRRERLNGCEVVDVSTAGIAVKGRLPEGYRVGMRLRDLHLRFPDGDAVVLSARVARVQVLDGEHRIGLQLEAMSAEVRQRLARYVFERHPKFGHR